MSDVVAAPPPRFQPLLFTELPEAAGGRALRRRRPPSAVIPEESPPVAVTPPPVMTVAETPVFEPAALSNAELRALVEALPDGRLAFLLTETARTLKRRILTGGHDPDGEPVPEPDPILLRAAAAAVGELSGEDDVAAVSSPTAGYAAGNRGSGKKGERSRRQPHGGD